MRHLINELHVVRNPPLGDLTVEIGFQLIRRWLLTWRLDHDQQRSLAPLFVDAADHGCFSDLGMSGGDVFHFDGGNPFAPRLDDIFRAVGNGHKALRTHRGDITGLEPPLLGMRLGTIELEIAGADPGSAYLERAKRLAIPGQFVVVVIGNFDLNAPDRRAHVGAHFGKLLWTVELAVTTRVIGCPQRAHFGHAPGVSRIDTIGVELFHDRQGASRTANDDPG